MKDALLTGILLFTFLFLACGLGFLGLAAK